jgi:hypothetical protein
MRHATILIFFLILIFSNCKNRDSKYEYNADSKIDTSGVIKSVDLQSIDIYGNWFLPEYTDSTIKYKKVYYFSVEFPIAMFGYEISITKSDSVIFRGYHDGGKYALEYISKNKYRAGDKNQYHTLTFVKDKVGSKLIVKEFVDPKMAFKADPKEYSFYRKDLSVGIEGSYFVRNILAGDYVDIKTKAKLVLKDNLELLGVDSLNRYSIETDPWGMVPQMDIIYFYYGDYNKHASYNWRFEDDYLILSSIINLYDKGGDYDGAKVDKEVYRLRKKK